MLHHSLCYFSSSPTKITLFLTYSSCRDEEEQSHQTHLFFCLLLHLLQVGPQVHVDRVLGAQQSLQHGVGRHTDLLQSGFLHTPQVHDFDVQVFNLWAGEVCELVSCSKRNVQ